MKIARTAVVSGLMLAAALASAPVFAHGPHVRFGVFVGAPWPYYYGPYYAPPPYYYPPYAPVAMPASPPQYIEHGDVQPAPPQQQSENYWYFCPETKGYYPYVQQCQGGWQRVVPQPPNS